MSVRLFIVLLAVSKMVYVMSVKPKSSSHGSRRRFLLIVSLILVVVLISSLFVYVFVVDNKGVIHVKSEVELRRAIDGVKFSESAIIAFDRDVSLIGTLIVPVGRDITLVSSKGDGFFKLFGPNGDTVLRVESGGVLRLDGIIVTHANGINGNGVEVNVGGTLIMLDGEISNNICETFGGLGGGVNNMGTFELYGGKISDNIFSLNGAGVSNSNTAVFKMFGGVISNNTSLHSCGGGVSSSGTFVMSGGVISGNIAKSVYSGLGGGVYLSWGTFEMSGGEISGNVAREGGGVYLCKDTFNWTGGIISGNTADTDNDVCKNGIW